MECRDQRRRIEQDRAVGHGQVALLDRLEVLPRYPRLTDRPSAQIEQLVTVVLDLVEELGHAGLGPVFAHDGQDVAQHVGPRDGPVDVRDDDLVVRPPLVQVAGAPGGALVRRRHAEHHLVHAVAEVQQRLQHPQISLPSSALTTTAYDLLRAQTQGLLALLRQLTRLGYVDGALLALRFGTHGDFLHHCQHRQRIITLSRFRPANHFLPEISDEIICSSPISMAVSLASTTVLASVAGVVSLDVFGLLQCHHDVFGSCFESLS
jgi:hypothetical protein